MDISRWEDWLITQHGHMDAMNEWSPDSFFFFFLVLGTGPSHVAIGNMGVCAELNAAKIIVILSSLHIL